jgi:molecular chaperone HscC
MDENGPILTSKAAEERLITHPFKTTFLFKRHMGFNKRVMLNDNSFRCEEFASFVLCALKANAQSVLEEPVTHASISVPAYFSDRPPARQAILRALYPERLINEPTTAVLAYRLHQKKAISPPLYLIWMAEHLMSHYLTFSTASRRFAPLPVTTLWVEKILFRPC